MKPITVSLLCLAFAAGGFFLGGNVREHRVAATPAAATDDMWWAHIPNAYYYGVRLSRDPSCRSDLETCIKALDCQANARDSIMRKETLGNPACQAAWRAHPAVLQPANPAIRENPDSPQMRALRAESDKLAAQSLAEAMCLASGAHLGTDGHCYSSSQRLPPGVRLVKEAQ